MSLSKQRIDEFRDLYQRDCGVTLSDEEATEMANHFINLMKILIKISPEKKYRMERLKTEPDGFLLSGDCTEKCIVCNKTIHGLGGWWNKQGATCLDCHNNIIEGLISFEILDSKKYFTNSMLADAGINHSKAKRLCKIGTLKAKEFKSKDGIPYFSIYLYSDNKIFFEYLNQQNLISYWDTT